MLTSRSALVLATIALSTWASAAEAQVSRAPRGFRGIFGSRQPTDPARPRQDLLLSVSATGGYDDNVGAGETVGPPVVGADNGSGTTSQLDVALDYRRGSSTRTFGLASWGSFTDYYGETTLPDTRNGGVGLTGRWEVSRRNSLGGGARFSYLSELPISQGLQIGQEPNTIPPAAGLTGLYDRGSWATSLDANAERRWSQRSSTRLDYSFSTTEFVDGRDGDDRSHNLQATHRRLFSRASSIDVGYDFGKTIVGLSDGGDPGQPRTEQRVYGGFTVSKRLSSTRSLDVTAHGGALYLDATAPTTSVDYQLWTPYAQASVRAGVFGQWAVETAYERSTESIPGFQRPETYVTDTVMASFGGVIGRRVDVTFSGAFAAGDVGVDAGRSEYTTTSAAAQMRIRIVRNLAGIVGYSFYHYEFTDTLLPVGLPPAFDRNAFRVGLTWALPIIGGDGR